jgi:hypothetical protein
MNPTWRFHWIDAPATHSGRIPMTTWQITIFNFRGCEGNQRMLDTNGGSDAEEHKAHYPRRTARRCLPA